MKIGAIVKRDIYRPPVANGSLACSETKLGIEVELRGWKGDPRATEFTAHWEGKEDLSVKETGREFITRGGLVGDSLVSAIDALYQQFELKGWNDGYPYAGIHVHMDCTNMDDSGKASLARFVGAYMLIEHMLFSFAGDYRRVCGFCYSLEESTGVYDDLIKVFAPRISSEMTSTLTRAALPKYQAMNLRPLRDLGTVEFRHLPTTGDKERLMLWINVLLMLRKNFGNLPEFKYVTRANIRDMLWHPRIPTWEVFGDLFDEGSLQRAKENIQFLMYRQRPEDVSWTGAEIIDASVIANGIGENYARIKSLYLGDQR